MELPYTDKENQNCSSKFYLIVDKILYKNYENYPLKLKNALWAIRNTS